MKKVFTLTLIIALTISVSSQPPQKMSYQCVVRNSSGALVTNHVVGIKISILQGSATGTVVFAETYSPAPQTNANGLITVEIGSGSPITGTFTGINWATGPYYLKTETDPAGGTTYTIVGTNQLLSVPYALYAKTSAENDPTWNGAANQTGDIGRTGNVGIGTTTPSARLDVTGGDALINELAVGKGGGSQLANTAVGYSALSSNTSGIYNTAFGNAALFNNTGGEKNTALGFRALFNNTTGEENSASGMWALFSNSAGNSNTATGQEALYANIGGHYNTANGTDVLHENTSGGYNTASGFGALYYNTTGMNNTAIGQYALKSNKTGDRNTAIGTSALENNTGTQNTASGGYALYNNSGNQNTAGGYGALYYNTTGINNTAIGYSSGTSSTIFLTGGKNTFIGFNTGYTIGTITNSTALGADVTLTNSNTVILGNNANVGIGTTNPGYKLDVSGTANLNNSIASGIAIRCNGAEALWYNGTYFSWGHDATYNYYADPVSIGTAGAPGYTLVVNGTAAKTDGGSWSVLSDFRLKDLVGNYDKGLKEILDLQAVRFTYKEGNSRQLTPDEEQIGFIAQDVQKIFPEAVNECKDGYLDFNMHPVNVAMVNAIKELKAENDELKARVEKLESIIGTEAKR